LLDARPSLLTCTAVSPFCSTARAELQLLRSGAAGAAAVPPGSDAAGSSRDTLLLTGFKRPRKVLRLQAEEGV
jgi:hypothetical protein